MATPTNPTNSAKAPTPPAASTPPMKAQYVEASKRPAPNPVSLGAAVSAAINSEPGEPAQAPVTATVTEPQAEAVETREENALVASSAAITALEEESLIERQSAEARLPVQLDVGIPIRDFRVKNLLSLAPGTLIESQWEPGADVPIVSGEAQLAWSEFEVVDMQLAVRLTRLT